MAGYLKSRFYEHQFITAIISRHLADNYVKPDDTLASKVSSLEKLIEKLSKTLSQLESSVKDHDKTISASDRSMKGIQAKLDKLESKQQKNGGAPGGPRNP
jgi:septal ring factor EnvC (AmiA/AmiB activator)